MTSYQNGPVPVVGACHVKVTVTGPVPMFWPLLGWVGVALPGVWQSLTLKTTAVMVLLISTGPPVGPCAEACANEAV